jgi:hypothetical protein
MGRIFDTAGSQLGLSQTDKEHMKHLMTRALTFLSERRESYSKARKERDVEMLAKETMEEKKARKTIEEREREKDIAQNSILSRLGPLAGAIIYATCRANGKPLTLSNIAVRLPLCPQSLHIVVCLLTR